MIKKNALTVRATCLVMAALTLAFSACAKVDAPSEQVGTRNADPLPVLRTPGGAKMLLIPAGRFIMGDSQGNADEAVHEVYVDSFYMDCTPITQELYRAVMHKSPSKWKAAKNPVEQVQWVDAARFCNRCSERENLTPCYDPVTWRCDFNASGYRLPTEAEWEYACRAGTHTRYSFGDDPADLAKFGWCKPHSRGRPHPVATRRPNPWGLFDMHGNVWQWCTDYYSPTPAIDATAKNPRGPTVGTQRVLRGGSWKSSADACRSASRRKEFPVFTDACFGADSYGFRRVRNARPAGQAATTSPSIVRSEPDAGPTSSRREEEEATARPGAPQTNSPSPASDGKIDPARLTGSIVFVSDRSGTTDIWVMHADGSHPRQLTGDAEADADPRFSPDGHQVLYTTLRGGFPEIWKMHLDGAGKTRVTDGSQAAWSPAGESIVFIRDDQAYVRDLESGQERRLSPPDWVRCGVPAWSHDGSQIALASRHLGTIGVFLLNVSGEGQRQLSTEDPCCTPAWSGDDQRLLFQTVKGHIHELDLATGSEEQLTFGADIQRDARYSPDGTMAVFCRAPTQEGPWQICILDLDSDDLTVVQLTHQGSNQLPDWHAIGK